jgi:hypothetical protein
VKEAKQRVAQYHGEQRERGKARKKISKEVADIIEMHSMKYPAD